MESSEEEDIIEYDEDDYGEFVIKNNNAILIAKGNKSKNQEKVNNSINMGAESNKLSLKMKKKDYIMKNWHKIGN